MKPIATHVTSTHFYAVSRNERAVVYDLTSNRLDEFQMHHSQAASAVCYSPDGQTIIAGTPRGDLSFFDSRTGQLRFQIDRLFSTRVEGLTFSPDGKTLLAIDSHGEVQTWTSSDTYPNG